MLTLYLPTGRAALAPIGDPDPPCIGGYMEKGSDPNGSLPFFLCVVVTVILPVTLPVTNFSCIRYSKLCFYMNFSAIPYVNFSM